MFEDLARLAETEFGDIVMGWHFIYRRSSIPLKLRLQIRDGTFIDIWVNDSGDRYSYHWEQRAVRGLIHRHDNAPDHPEVSTFPKHFHDGSEENIHPGNLADDPLAAVREFLAFVRKNLESEGNS
jgi:hypothetical protein